MSYRTEQHPAPLPSSIDFETAKLYRALTAASRTLAELKGTAEAKEGTRYRDALRRGYNTWLQRECIYENMLIEMFQCLKQRKDDYRRIPGTVLRNYLKDWGYKARLFVTKLNKLYTY